MLFVSDLDGTLLNNEGVLNPKTITEINESIASGVNFTIASARTPATINVLLKELNLNIPIITMNGSAIYDTKEDKYIHYTYLNKNEVIQISNIVNSLNMNAFVYSLKKNHLYVNYNDLSHSHQLKFYEERNNSPYKTFIKGEHSTDNILYFTIMDYEDKVDILYNKLKTLDNIFITKYRDTYNKDIFNLEIYHRNSTKSNAIKILQEKYNFTTVIAFGDNLNDIPMFKTSSESYAVENAVEELKQLATGIIGPNYLDSVSTFIKNYK